MMARANTPPLSATYLNVQEARAAATALTAAWDAAPTTMICPYFESVTLHFTYTRGAANGAFDFQVEYSPYSVAANVPGSAEEWITMALYDSGAVAAGVDSTSNIQCELITYQPVGAGAEDFPYPIALNATVERIRVRARESGVPGTPGTLQIEAVFS